MGFLSDLQSSKEHARLNTLLADRAAGKPVSDDAIASATLVVRLMDRATAAEQQNKAIQAVEVSVARQQQIANEERARTKLNETIKANEEGFTNDLNLLSAIESKSKGCEILFEKYFKDFYSEYYVSLLSLFPLLYDDSSNKIKLKDYQPGNEDFNAVSFFASDFLNLGLTLLEKRSALSEEDALVWSENKYWLSGGENSSIKLSSNIVLANSFYLKRDKVELFTHTVDAYGILGKCIEDLNADIRDKRLNFELDEIPESIVLKVVTKYDGLNNTKYANTVKKLLFTFAKSFCGWNSSVTQVEMNFLKSYKMYLENFK